ncbi:MAG: hemerythrin domain-containing protein, partial [Chloroflexota bacterium]
QAGQTDGALEVLKDSLAFFEGELERHFRHEELALFPALARVIGRAGPVGAMLAEHESIWNAVDRLAASVEEIEDSKEILGPRAAQHAAQAASLIVFLLRGHIQREDTMLFPLAESTLDVAAKHEVDLNIEIVNGEQSRTSVA